MCYVSVLVPRKIHQHNTKISRPYSLLLVLTFTIQLEWSVLQLSFVVENRIGRRIKCELQVYVLSHVSLLELEILSLIKKFMTDWSPLINGIHVLIPYCSGSVQSLPVSGIPRRPLGRWLSNLLFMSSSHRMIRSVSLGLGPPRRPLSYCWSHWGRILPPWLIRITGPRGIQYIIYITIFFNRWLLHAVHVILFESGSSRIWVLFFTLLVRNIHKGKSLLVLIRK